MRFVVGAAAVVLLAACSSGTPTPRAHAVQPSGAARIACGDEAFSDVADALGLTAAPLAPTWTAPTYSCRYVYPTGVMVVSVTDNASPAAATTAFTAGRPSDAATIPAVGQDAYARADGSAVVRKDSQILTVDVSGLPDPFGSPPHPRNIQAIDIALVILECWTEG
jgi:hypothetical protein